MKKIAVFTLVFAVVFLLLSPVALAANNDLDKVIFQVEKANEQIYDLIDKAVEKADKFKDSKNEDKSVEKIISKLIEQTNKISEKTIEKAAKSGAEVYCELIEVEIGGQVVLIDPLIIGGW